MILGVAEGPEGGAAVVVDDRLVAAVDQAHVEAAEDMPWRAAVQALALAGLTPAAVDLVAVAGKYTPMFLRRRPGLLKLLQAPFSPVFEATVAVQALLRHSGIAAFQADVAAEWAHQRFVDRGYHQRRTITVDVHRALAEAAYRLQPEPEALVITVQPLAEGVALAVHLGALGQLDRVYEQKGFEALHTHLARVMAILGIGERHMHRIGALAARGAPDARLDRLLGEHFRADGPRLSRGSYPRSGRTADAAHARMRELSPADAAASVLDNLALAFEEVVGWHLQEHRMDHLCVAGSVFEDPRLVARLSELPQVRRLTVLPQPGPRLLAWGAAVDAGGLSPHLPDLAVGEPVDHDEVTELLRRAGLEGSPAPALVDLLAGGGALVRFRGRRARGRVGLGGRCVLVRADSAEAVARVRRALSVPEHEEPVLIVADEGVRFDREEVLGPGAGWGVAALRLSGEAAANLAPSLGADGRAAMIRLGPDADPALRVLVSGVQRACGAMALAAFPIAESDSPEAADAAYALDTWRRSGLEAIQLGAVAVGRRP